MTTVKAITLQDPYGTLVATGHKQYETRSWTTPYRGLVVIHVGKTLAINWQDTIFLKLLRDAGIPDPRKLPVGVAVCVCELTAIYRTEDVLAHISDRELAFGNYAPGRAAWKLENVQRFDKPIPARGAQGLWNWPMKLPEGIAV